eukprot:TRINITY_DN25378_c0_g1_i1.p1 TRINITY_DN25378_c0_g1~~TRINITY_DN25378_c0_g1_i1.p1  ORF type:complete len:168 (-),score=5.91 TRINITY_DN25378_c0_g1_i1:59-562(-)
MILSIIYSFCICYNYGFLAIGSATPEWYPKYYASPLTRIPPYIFGMLVGLWYIEEKGSLTKMFANSRVLQIIVSLLGLYTMYLIVTVVEPVIKDNKAFSQVQNALYLSVGRTWFVAGLTAFLMPSFVGSKFLQQLLGNRIFETLAKLNFTTYMVHLIVTIYLSLIHI